MKNGHTVIEIDQKAWSKLCIHINTELKKNAKIISKKMVVNNAVFGKTMENVRKYRDIKLITTEERIIYLKTFF